MVQKKVALITETGNGLSFEFAEILKSQNIEVIIAMQEGSILKRDRWNLKGIELIPFDITNKADIVSLYSHIKTTYERLDILINNAEIVNGFGQKISEINLTDIRRLYDINLFSVINTTKTMFNLLNKSEKATIINITSDLGNVDKMKDNNFCYSNYKVTAYSTAKSALEMFTVLLEKELKPMNIQVKSFEPVRLKNSTHNSLKICNGVKKEFIELLP